MNIAALCSASQKKAGGPIQSPEGACSCVKDGKLEKAHFDIENLFTSQKTQWVAGAHGL